MTSLRTRLKAAVTLTAAVTLALAACSSGGSNNGSPTTEPLPDDQQNLTYVLNWGCTMLDVTANFTNCSMQVASNVMQGLVALDPATHDAKPLLAQSWTWTDPTTLTFKLRDDVTFSDGTKFTSADVKATFDRYIAQKSVLGTQLAVVSSYTADDPTTFTLHTKQSTGTLLGLLSIIFIGQATHATEDAYWSKPIGTGAFIINDFTANDHISMSRNGNFWGEKAKLKTLTFKQIDNISSRITALSNGSAQVIAGVPNDQIATVKSFPDVTFTQIPSLTYNFLWFQNSKAPFNDVRVRMAMWRALDLPTIVSSLLGDTAKTMTSLCPEVAFGCLPSDKAPKYDPAAAKKLLADAGYPNGFSTTIDFSTANAGNDQLVTAMISYWKAIGVMVTPKADDQATFTKAIASPGSFDMIVNPNLNNTGDADFTLNRLYTCAAKRLGYCNPELDALLSKAQQETDSSKRLAIYQQVSDLLATQAPGIGLYQININVAASSKVRGLNLIPNENYDWSTVHLAK
jgi:peptide/nickel transport system substrate-binding protein